MKMVTGLLAATMALTINLKGQHDEDCLSLLKRKCDSENDGFMSANFEASCVLSNIKIELEDDQSKRGLVLDALDGDGATYDEICNA